MGPLGKPAGCLRGLAPWETDFETPTFLGCDLWVTMLTGAASYPPQEAGAESPGKAST